jgi:hypothetical protein
MATSNIVAIDWKSIGCDKCVSRASRRRQASHNGNLTQENSDKLPVMGLLLKKIPSFRWCIGPVKLSRLRFFAKSTVETMGVAKKKSSTVFIPCSHRDVKCKKKTCENGCGNCERHCNCHHEIAKKTVMATKRKTAFKNVTNLTCRGKACKVSMCPCSGGKCIRHCKCRINRTSKKERTEAPPQKPKTYRSNHDEVLGKLQSLSIQEKIVDKDVSEEETKKRESKAGKLEGLLSFLDLTPTAKLHNMPSKKLRDNRSGLSFMSERGVSTLTNVFADIIGAVATILHPGDPDALAVLLLDKIKAGVKSKKQEAAESLVANTFQLCCTLPQHITSYRVLRAVLVGSIKPAVMASFDMDPKPHFGRKAKASGHRDFETMVSNNKDPIKKKRTLARISDSVLEGAVSDILSNKNVGLLSWGTITVKIPGEFGKVVILPKTTRKRSMEAMFEGYRKAVLQDARNSGTRLTRKAINDLPMLRRSSYLNVTRNITGQSEKMIMSVDYCTDILVNEKMQVLQRIVNELVAPIQKKRCTKLLVLTMNFLKQQYNSHAIQEDKVRRHCVTIRQGRCTHYVLLCCSTNSVACMGFDMA